ncbi:YraN family protein [Thiomicrorhabdus sp. 6S3-12]|uniref:YraN family protein n=1 Tax=Thiomicrorhabdus sp. 6S3-12 TaxID=2819681 RepID=UPI0035302656
MSNSQRRKLPKLPDLVSKLIGQQKEQQAERWLQAQNIKILERNFRCDRFKKGEIDLIGMEKDHQTLIFFEVKYRKNCDFGHPLEFITSGQQARIRRCAEVFLQKHPQYQTSDCRFDVISFTADDDPEWIKNAF